MATLDKQQHKKHSTAEHTNKDDSARENQWQKDYMSFFAAFGLFCLIVILLMQVPPTRSDEILLIVGGSEKSSEVLSLRSRPLKCGITVPDLPVSGIWGSFFEYNNDPVFCEGSNSSPCYKYSPKSGSWQNFHKLTAQRYAPAVLQLDDYILITGGHNSSSSDHYTPSKQEFMPGPELPYAVEGHCIAALNKTHALMAGGQTGDSDFTNKAFIFNQPTGKWTETESMEEKRGFHACGLVSQSKVLVAGGYNENSLLTAEIFNLETQAWNSVEELPYKIDEATSVQLEDKFLMVGGYSKSEGILNTLYEYDISSNTWLLWEQKLKLARRDRPAVYKLPAEYLNCV